MNPPNRAPIENRARTGPRAVPNLASIGLAILGLAILALAWLAPSTRAATAGSDAEAETENRAETKAETGAKAPSLRFVEKAEAAGVRFVHSTRDFGERHKAEVLEMFTEGGSAVAVGDFDADGNDDLFLTDSAVDGRNLLLRNRGDATFEDVTEQAGVAGGNDDRSIVADGLFLDYDDDGHLDLLVGRFGTPILYRNPGTEKGRVARFEDVSEAVGLTAFGNTIAVIAFDADADGFLDLLLANYFQPENLLHLDTPHVLPNNLDYADNGGGVTFWQNVAKADAPGGRAYVEKTREAGFAHHTGWSLDLGHADLDNDGDQDVYIAGDYGTDRLFWNQGDGTFVDDTEEAIGWDTKKGMNVDMGDYDRDGWLDIYVTNITDEYMKECNMLWHNNGDGTFVDLSRETGTCDTDWGWAAKFGDFDNDGWQDLFVVNGLRSRSEKNYIPVLLEMLITPNVDFSDVNSYPDIGNMTWSGYQKQRFFRNLADGTFQEMGAAAGVDNQLDGRGIGMADFDNDGRLDFYQANAAQPSLLYMNDSQGTGHWLQVSLEGRESNRQGIGARLTVRTGEESQIREVDGGNGYASQSSTRVHFGLGSAQRVDSIEVRWPSGKVQTLGPIRADRHLRIVEGEGGKTTSAGATEK